MPESYLLTSTDIDCNLFKCGIPEPANTFLHHWNGLVFRHCDLCSHRGVCLPSKQFRQPYSRWLAGLAPSALIFFNAMIRFPFIIFNFWAPVYCHTHSIFLFFLNLSFHCHYYFAVSKWFSPTWSWCCSHLLSISSAKKKIKALNSFLILFRNSFQAHLM